MEYLYVLDFCQNQIFEIELDDKDQDSANGIIDTELILNRRGLNIDNCEYMYSGKKLEIEQINII